MITWTARFLEKVSPLLLGDSSSVLGNGVLNHERMSLSYKN